MFDLKSRALPIINLLALAMLGVRIYMAFVQTDYAFIDDYTYVLAALRMADFVKCPLATQNACNYEHPPLAKLIEGLGFAIFGKTMVVGPYVGIAINQLGGRFFQMVMSTMSAPILYIVVNRITGNWKTAFVAALFILVDPLYFTLSLSTNLDVAMVFFGLLALLPYLYGVKLWKLNGSLLAGFFLGLSLLSKETALFIALAVATYALLRGPGDFKARLWSSLEILIGTGVTFAIGLQLFDSIFTTFPSFLSQLLLMVVYHSSAGPQQISYLKGGSDCNLYAGLCPTNASLVPHFLYSHLPLAILQSGSCVACWAATNPFDWLTFFPPVVFPTALVLVVNYPLVWMSFAWLPATAWGMFRHRTDRELDVLLLAASLFLWNLASNLFIYVVLGRTVFEYYFLPSVPAICMGGAYLLTRPQLPRWLACSLIAVVLGVGIFLSPVGLHSIFASSKACPGC